MQQESGAAAADAARMSVLGSEDNRPNAFHGLYLQDVFVASQDTGYFPKLQDRQPRPGVDRGDVRLAGRPYRDR